MSWLKSVTADTVVVHTRDGRSIRGVLVGAYRTEVVLAHASLLHAGVAHHLARGCRASPGTRQRHVPLRCGIRLYGIKAPLTRRTARLPPLRAAVGGRPRARRADRSGARPRRSRAEHAGLVTGPAFLACQSPACTPRVKTAFGVTRDRLRRVLTRSAPAFNLAGCEDDGGGWLSACIGGLPLATPRGWLRGRRYRRRWRV